MLKWIDKSKTTAVDTAADRDTIRVVGGVWLASLAGRLVMMMREDGIAEPLGESLTLAAVLSDLFTLAGAPVPLEIAKLIDAS